MSRKLKYYEKYLVGEYNGRIQVEPIREGNKTYAKNKNKISQWADQIEEIDNNFQKGYRVVTRFLKYSSSFDFHLEDPKGRKFNVPKWNIAEILKNEDLKGGGHIQTACKWARSNGYDVLMPEGSELHKGSIAASDVVTSKETMSLRDVNRGDRVLLTSSQEATYLGGFYRMVFTSRVGSSSYLKYPSIERHYYLIMESSKGKKRMVRESYPKIQKVVKSAVPPLFKEEALDEVLPFDLRDLVTSPTKFDKNDLDFIETGVGLSGIDWDVPQAFFVEKESSFFLYNHTGKGKPSNLMNVEEIEHERFKKEKVISFVPDPSRRSLWRNSKKETITDLSKCNWYSISVKLNGRENKVDRI